MVDDAEISISNGINTYINFGIEYINSNQRHKFYTNKSDLFIKPAAEYSIRIASNGEIISGSIKTTGDFEISNIEKIGSNDEETYYRVNWDRSENDHY